MDFSSFTASEWTTVGGGVWSKTPEGRLRVTAPQGTSTTGAACERLEGSALLRTSAVMLPDLRSARARVRIVGPGKGAAGFIFRHVDGRDYATLTVFNDGSCGGFTGIVAGFARNNGNSFIKQPWVNQPADFVIADNWVTFSIDVVNNMLRWKLQSDKFTEGRADAFFSDPIFGFLQDKANATNGGGFGFYCSPGATCEFDNAVMFETAKSQKLTGHLFCYYCDAIWPVPSTDWCRCCQYSCGGAGESTREACRTQGFCSAPNRCQNTPDIDKGFPVKYCDAHQITASDKPQPTQAPTSPPASEAPTTTSATPITGTPMSSAAALSNQIVALLMLFVAFSLVL
jgi:hypothetical protein